MTRIEIHSSPMKNTAFAIRSILAVLTLGSYLLGIDHLLGFSRVAMSAFLVIAFVKVWLVTQHFMDVRHSPRWMTVLVNGWIIVTGALVIGLCVAR